MKPDFDWQNFSKRHRLVACLPTRCEGECVKCEATLLLKGT